MNRVGSAFILLFFSAIAPVQLFGQAATEAMSIEKYVLRLEPNLTERSIRGELSLFFHATSDPREFTLDIGSLTIDGVSYGNQPLFFRELENQIAFRLHPTELTRTTPVKLSYHGSPEYGMRFENNGVELSTGFSTSQWMPTMDSPQERAALDITLVLPEEFKVAASGILLDQFENENGDLESRWYESDALPSYLYGFAAGTFTELVDETATPKLRYLTPPSFDPKEISTIFESSRDMIAFFEEVSGIPFPDQSYTQVLLREGVGQELNEMAVMGTRYGLGVLADETQIWLGAHELAHQWWGNRITNVAWTHFWLNEGLVSFMTAAYLERRFGRELYERNMTAAREQLQRLREAGHDKPLVFPDWERPSREDRSVVYDKGSYVVHLLRETLGEEAFWRGIKLYSQRHWNGSVNSQDFQAAMEDASATDLHAFFDEWVY